MLLENVSISLHRCAVRAAITCCSSMCPTALQSASSVASRYGCLAQLARVASTWVRGSMVMRW